MSYPYDNPSFSMNGTWVSGNYTPDIVVNAIRDNYSPINKNTMRNSVGNQISLIQNFVNSKYLGRQSIPIQSGWIMWMSGGDMVLSGTISATMLECPWDTNNNYYVNMNNQRIYYYGFPSNRIINGTYTADSIEILNINNGGGASKYITNINNSGYTHYYMSDAGGNNTHNYAYSSAISGFGHSKFVADFGYQKQYDTIKMLSSGIYFDYTDLDTPTDNVHMHIKTINSSGQMDISGSLLCLQAKVVIGSGRPYEEGAPGYYSLTVNKPETGGAGGDVFIETHGGPGVDIRGDNGVYSRITVPTGYLRMGIDTDNTDMLIFSPSDAGNGISESIKIGSSTWFGLFDQSPTGQASYVSGTDAAAITAIKQVLINFGFMAAS